MGNLSAWREELPDVLLATTLGMERWQWLGLLVLIPLSLPLGALVQRVLLTVGARAARLSRTNGDDRLVEAAIGPLRLLATALLVAAAARVLRLPPTPVTYANLAATSLCIVAVAWLALRFVRMAAVLLENRVSPEDAASLDRVRSVRTQVAVLRRVVEAAIYLLGAGALLLQLDAVRSLGVSLLASAGVAGLVIGLAAQKSISTLLAGIQLSLTQPMRIGDTVIVENEWGWVEEITLTYVVVKVWDLRRLVVPITFFLDRPFQNWTKAGADILGTVELHADFRVDLAGLREELTRVLSTEAGALWDTKVKGVQVTACTDRTMTVRVLVSSADAGRSWDLRCLVRERLLHWLQRQPFGLPLIRAEALISEPGSATGPQRNVVRTE